MQKRDKRAQAATEFLTTYGWAILILLVIVVALASLGIFRSPQIPNLCASVNPISCSDVKVDSTTNPKTITFRLSATGSFEQTGMPTVTAITLTQPRNIDCGSISGNPIGSASTQISCTFTENIGKGSTFQGTITIIYTQKGALQHTLPLSFSGTVE